MPEDINERRALTHLMDLLAVEGTSGREAKVAAAIRSFLGSDRARYREGARALAVELSLTRSVERFLAEIAAPA